MESDILTWILAVAVPLGYLLGFGFAVDAVLKTRTPQGATAWVLGLIAMPFVALPLYWVFGRAKFGNYINALRDFDDEVAYRLQDGRTVSDSLVVKAESGDDERTRGELRAFEELSTLSFTRGNDVQLLIDGRETFDAIFAGIDSAMEYVLAQFYIINDDDIGRQFKKKLLNALDRGVRVYLMYDEVGSFDLPGRYRRELREAGAQVSGFSGKRRWFGRFRLNFRNHRKIVVIDGRTAYVGGLNVGDEYLGNHRKLSPWRDTHLKVSDPAVLGLQFSFTRDWYYGTQETPRLDWDYTRGSSTSDQQALVLASGPADHLETCGLLFTHAIESAEHRVWIATPYFVPDARVLGALQLAALRGVDVRVLVPRLADNILFKYVPYAYLPEAERAGVKIFIYEEGFMHQKVFLVDDDYGAVSTANFDNRSFLFNFEITCLVRDSRFCHEMAQMLLADFRRSTPLTGEDLLRKSRVFKFATKVTRLLAPVL